MWHTLSPEDIASAPDLYLYYTFDNINKYIVPVCSVPMLGSIETLLRLFLCLFSFYVFLILPPPEFHLFSYVFLHLRSQKTNLLVHIVFHDCSFFCIERI